MNRPVSGLLLVVVAAGVVSACTYNDPIYNGVIDERSPMPTTNGGAGPGNDGTTPAKGPQPVFGPTVRAAIAPPPLSGGTLAVLRDGRVVAADPDRDKVYIVDVRSRAFTTVALEANDEPGRVVEDDGGRVHVVLRRAGKLATIDTTQGTLIARRDVCPAPRGIAIDNGRTRAIVACESGELMALAADPAAVGAEATLLAKLDRDLRDVVVTPSRVFVSRLRSADVLELSTTFALLTRSRPIPPPGQRTMQAMRMVAAPAGDPVTTPLLVHEVGRDPVPSSSGSVSYQGSGSSAATVGPGCQGTGPIVLSAVSRTGIDSRTARAPDLAALPIDVAANAATIAIVAAGNAHTPGLPQIYTFPNARPVSSVGTRATPCFAESTNYPIEGEAIAVAFLDGNEMVVQSREPASLELLPSHTVIRLSSESRNDTGHALFHANSGAGLACASCHPEGGDDGQVWNLDKGGPMRTTSLKGTLAGTAPFHWNGDVPDFSTLSDRIMTGRMNGPSLDAAQKSSLETWLYELPGAKVAKPSAASERGRIVFERADIGCAKCHSGPLYTSPGNQNVGGNRGSFQVPSLVGVSSHAPFFHNGCGTNLQRLSCGGTVHDMSAKLSADEQSALVSYLETL